MKLTYWKFAGRSRVIRNSLLSLIRSVGFWRNMFTLQDNGKSALTLMHSHTWAVDTAFPWNIGFFYLYQMFLIHMIEYTSCMQALCALRLRLAQVNVYVAGFIYSGEIIIFCHPLWSHLSCCYEAQWGEWIGKDQRSRLAEWRLNSSVTPLKTTLPSCFLILFISFKNTSVLHPNFPSKVLSALVSSLRDIKEELTNLLLAAIFCCFC